MLTSRIDKLSHGCEILVDLSRLLSILAEGFRRLGLGAKATAIRFDNAAAETRMGMASKPCHVLEGTVFVDKGSSCKQETGFATSYLYDSFTQEACVNSGVQLAVVQLARKKGFYWMSNFQKPELSCHCSFLVTFQGAWSQP